MKKLIVVSGATRGIGRAIAEKFAKQGFDIVVSARNEAHLKTMQTQISQTYNVACYTHVADMSVKEEVLGFANFIKSLQRKVDVLVNNAGLYIQGNISTEEDGNLEKLMNTNLYSAYYLTKALLQEMIEQKDGHIFNICSIASLIAYNNSGAYTISKFALLGFSKSLREELKPHQVRVTSVMPGATFTDSWKDAPVSEDRLMPASDIAEIIWATYTLSKNSVVEDIVIRPQLGDL